MAFLIFKSLLHEQGKNLIEQRPSAELTRIICKLAKGSLAHRRCAVLDFEKESHNLSLFEFLNGHGVLISTIDELAEVCHILGLEEL